MCCASRWRWDDSCWSSSRSSNRHRSLLWGPTILGFYCCSSRCRSVTYSFQRTDSRKVSRGDSNSFGRANPEMCQGNRREHAFGTRRAKRLAKLPPALGCGQVEMFHLSRSTSCVVAPAFTHQAQHFCGIDTGAHGPCQSARCIIVGVPRTIFSCKRA